VNIRQFREHSPVLGARVYIDPQASVIGDVVLGDDCSVWPMCVIRGDVHSIRIGARTNVQDGSVLHVTHDGPAVAGGYPLVIGDEVTVGHKVLLHGCTIGNRCLVGMGSIVLDGVVVEDEVIIGAGSLVPPRKRLRSGTLWMGNPAREVRPLGPQEIEQFRYLSGHYVRLKESYGARS
jgi:carbonic anhydrase/acetyltransferase-like protein (isoleucine patch superfamily)